MNKQDYIDQNIRKHTLLEKRFSRRMASTLSAQMAEAADAISKHGIDGFRIMLRSFKFSDTGYSVLYDLYMITAAHYYRKTTRQINSRKFEVKAGFGINPEWIEALIEFIRLNLLIKAVLPIESTTKKRIGELLDQAIAEGWGIDKVVFSLKNDPITQSRARLIVRTELKMAENYGRQASRKDSPFQTEEIWISAHDLRTRTSHHEADGQKVDEGKLFKIKRYKGKKMVGYDMMTGPGDPTAHPENLCNCRCTSVVRAKRDASGKFIRKTKIFVALPGTWPQDRRTITV